MPFIHQNTLYIGNHVTQRTDFKDVEVEENGVLICKASDQIIIKPGFSTKPGAVFVAEIYPLICSYNKSSLNTNPYLNSVQNNIEPLPQQNEIVENGLIELYPNPANHTFTINTHNDLPVTYKIYTLQGKLLQTGNQKNVTVELPKGMYLVGIMNNNTKTIKKLVIN